MNLTNTNSGLTRLKDWRIVDQESCWDHKIISLEVNLETDHCVIGFHRNRFIIKKDKWEIFVLEKTLELAEDNRSEKRFR